MANRDQAILPTTLNGENGKVFIMLLSLDELCNSVLSHARKESFVDAVVTEYELFTPPDDEGDIIRPLCNLPVEIRQRILKKLEDDGHIVTFRTDDSRADIGIKFLRS